MPSATPGSVESTWFPACPILSSGGYHATYLPIARCEIDGENRLPAAISYEELTDPISPGLAEDTDMPAEQHPSGPPQIAGRLTHLEPEPPDQPANARAGRFIADVTGIEAHQPRGRREDAPDDNLSARRAKLELVAPPPVFSEACEAPAPHARHGAVPGSQVT